MVDWRDFLGDSKGGAPNGTWTLTVSGSTPNVAGVTLGSSQTYPFIFLIADANNDHAVDFNDMVIMAQNYNNTTPDIEEPRVWGDFNCDGFIDFNDLNLLAQLYNVTLS